MIRIENDCCDCAAGAYPCDPCCTRKRAKHYYCDHCGTETDLFYLNGEQLCIECVEASLESVE